MERASEVEGGKALFRNLHESEDRQHHPKTFVPESGGCGRCARLPENLRTEHLLNSMRLKSRSVAELTRSHEERF
jgi:hypothetical protein